MKKLKGVDQQGLLDQEIKWIEVKVTLAEFEYYTFYLTLYWIITLIERNLISFKSSLAFVDFSDLSRNSSN